MQLSEETKNVLKNFSTINQSVMFKPGTKIRTMSPQKSIMAEAVVDNEFEDSAGVYDLSRFLATLSLFKEPELEFGKSAFHIAEGSRSVSYVYAAESMIFTPPDKEIKLPSVDVECDLSWTDIQSVVRAAGVLGLPEICFSGDGDEVKMSARDSENPSADEFSIVVSSENVPETSFEAYIKVEYMKLLPNDYHMQISSKGLAHFNSERVQYWIAVESKNSKFG